ncbi:MAG: glycosyltransferase family 2 protein [Zestosphaera sp.]
MKVSVVVPTYNERENIHELLSRISRALDGFEYEVVVVDDNSPDGTAEYAAELSAIYPVRLVRREGKLGLTSAVIDGAKVARGDYVVVMDADLQHPPEVIRDLLKKADSCDLVIASRYVEGGGAEGFTFARRVISLGATYLARILIPHAKGVRDPMSGFFLVRRELLKDLKPVMPKGYKVLLEVLAHREGLKICEIPYTFCSRVRGASKLSRREILNYIKQLLMLMPDYYKFAVVGASGVAVNLGTVALLEHVLTVPHVIASAVGIEVSLTNNFVWNDLWTFRERRGGGWVARYLKYHLSTLAGNLAQYLASQAVYYTVLKVPVAAQAVGTVVGYVINYFLSRSYVWKGGSVSS